IAKAGEPSAEVSPSIEIKQLECFHGRRKVVDIEGLHLPKKQVIALVGNNGAGKSTLAAGLCGILKSNVTMVDGAELARRERLKRFYMVMQDVNHQLFAESVLDELMLTYEFDDQQKIDEAETLLEQLNLLQFKDQHPHSLSGGQKQRTSIATALFMQKSYLIFDEPTSGVDLTHMMRIADLIESIKERVELVLVITHDREFINACCDHVIELAEGKIIDQFAITG
ncbi:MAG: ATP-binding cassette domain-containing protein, partial [Chloroflexota bacterium]